MDPWFEGGANVPCLQSAQRNYAGFGAMEHRFLENVRGILPGDERDDSWRPVMDSDRPFVRTPAQLSHVEHQVLANWYYWKRNAV
jgi:hypothetical protein